MSRVSLIRDATVFILKTLTAEYEYNKLISRSIWINLKIPTQSKAFCDGLDFGSLQHPRCYTSCLQVNAIDPKEETLKTHDKKDSLKKMKINWWTFLFKRDL